VSRAGTATARLNIVDVLPVRKIRKNDAFTKSWP